MRYTDVYFRRINHMGYTKAEQAYNYGIAQFEQQLENSPHRVDLSSNTGLYFAAIILQNKEDENKKTMKMEVAVDIALKVGNIIYWPDGDTVEKWIIYQKERKVNETYQTFYIVRCNYHVKWIDAEGHVNCSWCYLVSSMDNKIKGNYRTWNSLITPQPNKYLEILMPDMVVAKGTRFVINEECWLMVEYDNTSVDGILYMSLTEEKLNLLNDDCVNNLADIDKIAEYTIIMPEGAQTFSVGEEINPIFTIMKNGLPVEDMAVGFIVSDNTMVNSVGDMLVATRPGNLELKIYLTKFPNIGNTIPLVIGERKVFSAYIDGQDKLKLNRSAEYKFLASEALVENVVFSLPADNKLATIVSFTNNSCVVKGNALNKLGKIILTAKYNGMTYEKEIQIVPLWQVRIWQLKQNHNVDSQLWAPIRLK